MDTNSNSTNPDEARLLRRIAELEAIILKSTDVNSEAVAKGLTKAQEQERKRQEEERFFREKFGI